MNTISPLVKKALYYASEKHDGQYRKGGKVPFIVHPTLVALAIQKYTDNENIIASAILHDTIEDCSTTYEDLSKLFNKQVADTVKEISSQHTGDKNKENWRKRKEDYLESISKISKETLLIVTADKMLNMEAYFSHAVEGKMELLNKLFNGKLEDYLWYYEELGKISESKLKKHPITKDYLKTLEYYKNSLIKK